MNVTYAEHVASKLWTSVFDQRSRRAHRPQLHPAVTPPKAICASFPSGYNSTRLRPKATEASVDEVAIASD